MNSKNHFALIGRNVSYSKSEDIFDAIFKLVGIPGQFDMFDVEPADLENRIRTLALNGVCGFSVTIPYKSSVIKFLDDIDPVARTLEAVNSVCVDDNRLLGYNTDCYGFGIPLLEYNERLKHGHALILGCGGAARAVLYSLYVDLEVRRFTVAGRSRSKLTEFTQKLGSRFERAMIDNAPIDTVSLRDRQQYDLIVNCTPLGGWNHTEESPLAHSFDFTRCRIYYDLNYNHDNKIVLAAREAGVTVIDGSAMLVGQAIRSFDIWTGQRVPFAPIYEIVFGSS